jgi:ABC-type molybdenum transport system ATPase subunit/photorepair protein PhrA
VILDDPVQAMDPAKVDGLVALLSKIAKKNPTGRGLLP